MTTQTLSAAVKHVERDGALLVFPLDNRAEPPSLWARFHPRSPMRWAWDDGGDDRVVRLWHLRTRLAVSGKVVYAKWFRGRATMFARDVFTALLAGLRPSGGARAGLSDDAGQILDLLDENSPVSTRVLREQSGLQGRALERPWTHAMNALWSRLLIVGHGEVEDGAFPSLAVGSTKALFEDLWDEADAMSGADADVALRARLGATSAFYKHYAKLRGATRPGR